MSAPMTDLLAVKYAEDLLDFMSRDPFGEKIPETRLNLSPAELLELGHTLLRKEAGK